MLLYVRLVWAIMSERCCWEVDLYRNQVHTKTIWLRSKFKTPAVEEKGGKRLILGVEIKMVSLKKKTDSSKTLNSSFFCMLVTPSTENTVVYPFSNPKSTTPHSRFGCWGGGVKGVAQKTSGKWCPCSANHVEANNLFKLPTLLHVNYSSFSWQYRSKNKLFFYHFKLPCDYEPNEE